MEVVNPFALPDKANLLKTNTSHIQGCLNEWTSVNMSGVNGDN